MNTMTYKGYTARVEWFIADLRQVRKEAPKRGTRFRLLSLLRALTAVATAR